MRDPRLCCLDIDRRVGLNNKFLEDNQYDIFNSVTVISLFTYKQYGNPLDEQPLKFIILLAKSKLFHYFTTYNRILDSNFFKQSIFTTEYEDKIMEKGEFKCFANTFTNCFWNFYEYEEIKKIMEGGGNEDKWFKKYLKYKDKYIKLKNSLV